MFGLVHGHVQLDTVGRGGAFSTGGARQLAERLRLLGIRLALISQKRGRGVQTVAWVFWAEGVSQIDFPTLLPEKMTSSGYFYVVFI